MNQVLHRVIVPPPAVSGKPKIVGPLCADVIREAVHYATKRWPSADEVGPLWRSLQGAGWRIEDHHPVGGDHLCQAPGCRAYAMLGWTAPGGIKGRVSAGEVWTCGAHAAVGEAFLASFRGEERPRVEPPPPEPLAQGALF